MTTTNFATSGERASKLAGRSINRERDKPECYRKLRSRSASPTFSTPPKVVVVSLETSRLSQCPPPFTSRPTPPSHKADLIKCTLSNNDHISRVVFLHGGCISLSLSLSPAFLPSWKASTREASMKMKGLDVAPLFLPPSLPIPREHAAKGRMVGYMYRMENIPASSRIYASRLFTRQ